MRVFSFAFVVFVVAALVASCSAVPRAPADTVTISVVRYSGAPLSQYQTKVMNEATKLAMACRLFRYFYGRWPANLQEIERKTTGIDYGIFLGQAKVTPNSDDSEDISIFDGQNTRVDHATPIDFHMPKSVRTAAQAPGFKIDVGEDLQHATSGANNSIQRTPNHYAGLRR